MDDTEDGWATYAAGAIVAYHEPLPPAPEQRGGSGPDHGDLPGHPGSCRGPGLSAAGVAAIGPGEEAFVPLIEALATRRDSSRALPGLSLIHI